MKKGLSLFALVFLQYFCFSQTKIETTSWLTSKYNKWKITDNRPYYQNGVIVGGTTEKPISISFVNCTMTIKTNSFYYLSSGVYDVNTYSLNIGDISNIEWVNSDNTDYLVITTAGSQVKKTIVTKSKYSFNEKESSDYDEKYFDRCIIALNTTGENDFSSRMLKAFNHLRSFCTPSKKEKEVF